MSTVVAVINIGEREQALALLLERLTAADENERERVRRLAVAIFADLGGEDPLALRYRRRLATALY